MPRERSVAIQSVDNRQGNFQESDEEKDWLTHLVGVLVRLFGWIFGGTLLSLLKEQTGSWCTDVLAYSNIRCCAKAAGRT